MNQDALERLRNRVKPTVESRDLSPIPSVNNHQDLGKDEASLTFNTQKDISNSSNQDIEISTSKNRGRLDLEKLSSSSKSVGDEFDEVIAGSDVQRQSTNDSSSMDIETKQSTIRLEKKLSQRLTQQCQSEEISREVFLEALFVYFENHKSMQSKVLQEARKRDGQRQKLANYRRAKSMIERFSGA